MELAIVSRVAPSQSRSAWAMVSAIIEEPKAQTLSQVIGRIELKGNRHPGRALLKLEHPRSRTSDVEADVLEACYRG